MQEIHERTGSSNKIPWAEALKLGRRGIPVFPFKNLPGQGDDKKPLTEHGFKDASTDPDIIHGWWTDHPNALIGVPTGPKFVVVDIDLEHADAQEWLADNRHRVPLTRTHRTRSGGLHCLFAPNNKVRCSTSRLGPHVDTRGEGGYIIWWPAIGLEVLHGAVFARVPDWMIEALNPKPPPQRSVARATKAPPDRTIAGIIHTIAGAHEGERNHITFWGACRFAELVQQGTLREGEAIDIIYRSCQPCRSSSRRGAQGGAQCISNNRNLSMDPKDIVDKAIGKKRILGEGVDGSAINGAELLDEVHKFLGRFVSYPSEHAHTAHVLWNAHTHLMEVWDSTPRLAFLSPEPKSGKTRAIEVSASLVPLPVEAVNVSPAYLFRKVGGDDGRPTILFDEVDTVFGPKAKENEEVRGLLNAGHRKGAVAGRCVVHGKQVMTEEIPAYCAVALAGLGWLPDTILTRSIIIRMRRRKPGEKVEPWRHRIHAKEGEALGDHLAGWARHVQPLMMGVYPEMPPGIEDRDADVWEALLAVADAAGGDWPKAARAAAVALVKEATEVEPSLGIRLLHDLRTVFGARAHMRTAAILEGLIALPESPWGDLKGKPINDRILARRLQQYGIKSKDIKAEGRALKGYTREDLHDAWLRYLPLVTPERRDQRDQRDDPSEFAAAATEPVADSPFSKRDHSAAKRDQGANGRDDERDPDFEGDQNSSRILSSVAEVADVALVRGNGGDGDGKSNGSQIGGTETDPRHLPLAEAMAYRQINVDEVWITSKAGGGYHRDRNRTRR